MRKKRESRLPFSRRPSAWPLASLVPRKHVPRTRAPPVTLRVLHTQRDLYEPFSHDLSGPRLAIFRTLAFSHTSAFSTRPLRTAPLYSLSPSALRALSKHERPAARPLTRAPRSLLRSHSPELSLSAVSPASFGRVPSLHQSGVDTPPLPLPLLAPETGR